MSSDMHVIFTGALPTKGRLQEAMAALGFHITFPDPDTPLENHGGGFMPMLFQGEKKTGVEFDIFERPGAVEEFGIDRILEIPAAVEEFGIDRESRFDRVAYFRWGIDLMEGIVATCAAVALAQLTGGIVYESSADELLPQDEAITMARSGFKHALKS
jgi:hypothetical protein